MVSKLLSDTQRPERFVKILNASVRVNILEAQTPSEMNRHNDKAQRLRETVFLLVLI